MSDYVSRGRAVKVQRITEAIDRAWLERGANIFAEEIIEKTLGRVRGMTKEEWRGLCVKHEIREPSSETTADVIQFFEDRLEQVRTSRREAKGIEE